MPMFNEKTVKIIGCFVVWDGITRPDTGQDGKPKYSLKVVVNPNTPDIGLFQQLANTSLQQSKFQGVLPQGGRMPIGQAQPNEFNGLYNGWAVLNCNSQRLPDVYDENGQRLDPMQYGAAIFGGQQVDVLVHCYEYDKAGNRGIATGLDAFSIIASANAQRQNFGGGIDTSGAFGGGGGQPAQQQQTQQYQNQPGNFPQQQPDQNQQQNFQQQQPAQNQQNFQQQPDQNQQQNFQQNPQGQQPQQNFQQQQPAQDQNQQQNFQQNPQGQQPQGNQPQQAHNFLPNQ